jgi:hypothetical protein
MEALIKLISMIVFIYIGYRVSIAWEKKKAKIYADQFNKDKK